MNELIELAHQFLQNFCLGDRQNQALLYKRIDLFLNPGVGINRNTYMEQLFSIFCIKDLKTSQYFDKNNFTFCIYYFYQEEGMKYHNFLVQELFLTDI